MVASIPNLSQTLAQATQIFDDRAAQSASFAEWWNGTRAQAIRQAMDHVRAVSDYLGDEILLAAPVNGPPIVLAEVRRDGLDAYLTQIGITGPRAFDGNLVVLGATAVPAVGAISSESPGRAAARKLSERRGTSFSREHGTNRRAKRTYY